MMSQRSSCVALRQPQLGQTCRFSPAAVPGISRRANQGVPLTWQTREGRLTKLRVSSELSEECKGEIKRRDVLFGLPSAAGALGVLAPALRPPTALAAPSFTAPPPGFRLFVDRFDGYSFYIPETWQQVRGSGQDCFFRSPAALDENISVQVSSPSSSRFFDITDLGSPEEAGQKLLKQFVTEFMSTRLGVKREPQLLRTAARTTWDGDDYYEIEVGPACCAANLSPPSAGNPSLLQDELNVKSFANNNQMAILPEERTTMLEWDRHYLTVLGVANNRLYQLRAQVPERLLSEELPRLRQILNSFQTFEILAV